MPKSKRVTYSHSMTCRTGFHNSDASAATLVLRTFNKHVDDPTTWAPSRSYWGWAYLSFRPMWVAEPSDKEKDGK